MQAAVHVMREGYCIAHDLSAVVRASRHASSVRSAGYAAIMRAILPLLLLTASISAFAPAASAQAPDGKPYNFVVILCDDIGAPELACYGHPTHKTPNLDKLAKEGMRFETAWSTPLCSPTRVMLLTGKYASQTGWYSLIGRKFSPKPESPLYDVGKHTTFADVLKSKGYVTALAGKWQLSGELPTLVRDCGFDRYQMWAYKYNLPPGVEHTGAWEGKKRETTARYWNPSIIRDGKYRPTTPAEYGPDLHCDYLIDFIKANKDKPVLAYWPMVLTHGPHDPTPDLDHPGQKTEKGFAPSVRYMDHLVGRMVKTIDDAGLAKRTIILFMGDNGTAGAGKSTLTDAGAHVPFIVRAPGTVPAGVTSKALVSLVDVLPTIAELSGATIPESAGKIDGTSFANEMRGKQPAHRDVLINFLRDGRMARDARYVLQGDGVLMDTTKTPIAPADMNDADAKAAKEKLEAVLKPYPGPRPEQQLREQNAAAAGE
jgi:arylsulfatase A